MRPRIRDFIANDLASRLASRDESSARLSLPVLARHYGVSFTPIRAAIRELVESGVLLKQNDGRIRVNPEHITEVDGLVRPSSSDAGPSVGFGQRTAEFEASLAREVIERSLRGDTAYLREEATAARFGVGRTAIRQAFSRLAGRGLIVHVPRCGWRVRSFDEGDLRAYLDIRETLELKALELARSHLVEADLRRMLAANAADGASPRLDNNIHRYLVEKSGNAYIRDFFDRNGSYYTTLFDYAAPETRLVAQMARQHREILRALLARDWPRARRALAQHIREQRPIVQELMSRIGRGDVNAGSSAAPSQRA
jgi:DNA-binding GntR family transcriptional regulator